MEQSERESLRKKVLDFLTENGIEYELYTHPELSSIDECLEYWKDIHDATHCKNLFFRNHKGNRHYLVSMECHKDLDIHGLEHMVRQGKLSFASEERMMRCLGLHPGSVSAFGLINDIHPDNPNPKELFDDGHRVKYFIDSDLQKVGKISFHPCENTASVVVSHAGFMKFLEIWGGQVEWLDMSPGQHDAE
ncbi:MAG: prolyl-tRNA synthetase associated domain-containing protein [Bacteroidaceae bacterium]|nr:prolyl-tRNA synthetase associated domain-containing protein [Bacteroidaceae bacterium]